MQIQHTQWYNLLTTLRVLPALLEGYVFLNTKGSRIVRILLCLKYDLQPELGSGLPSRWRLRPTLPGSRVTRRDWRLATLAWSKWRSRKKNIVSLLPFYIVVSRNCCTKRVLCTSASTFPNFSDFNDEGAFATLLYWHIHIQCWWYPDLKPFQGIS